MCLISQMGVGLTTGGAHRCELSQLACFSWFFGLYKKLTMRIVQVDEHRASGSGIL